jgi:uncharacterized SAM-binding protein YcdF (DUF218 family)
MSAGYLCAEGGVCMMMAWAVLAGGIIVACFGLTVLVILAEGIRQQGRRMKTKPADTAIVLGAYTNGFRPSPPLLARLRASLDLYRNGYVKHIIVSGGRGDNETVAESSSMKRFLMMNGVDPGVVIEDWHSTDTWENLRNSAVVMENSHFQTCIIVSSDYHLPRAMAVARLLNLDASGWAAWSTNREFQFAIREVFAYLKYWWSGQLRVA